MKIISFISPRFNTARNNGRAEIAIIASDQTHNHNSHSHLQRHSELNDRLKATVDSLNTMEVVSPLTFARANQGAKRRFGSPIHGGGSVAMATGPTTAEDFEMDDSSCSYGFQSTKRRKRFPNEGAAGGAENSFSFQCKENNWSMSPFVQASTRSPHGAGKAISLAEFDVNMTPY